MTASESSTLAAGEWKVWQPWRWARHTHIVEQRTISLPPDLPVTKCYGTFPPWNWLQSPTSGHTYLLPSLLALLLSSANLDSCFAHLPSTCSAKQNIQTELLTTGARKNCVGMTRPQAFWDYFLLSLWLGITKNDNSYKTSRGWIFSNTNSRTYGRLILRYSQFCWIL